jgi:PKD repeat protein
VGERPVSGTRRKEARALGATVALVLAALLALAALAASATAAPFGELGKTRFKVGTGGGELNLGRGQLPFAVDSADGSYYVGDTLKSGAVPEYRIQKFDLKGKLQASVVFSPPEAKGSTTGTVGVELQLAADPARNRVYALVVYSRRERSEAEEKQEEKCEKEGGTRCEKFPLDEEALAAGDLYAFEYAAGKLESKRLKEGAIAPIVNEATFKAQGEKPKEALLEPRGMAVEPATGNVVIAGIEDERDNEQVEKEEAEKACRGVVESVLVAENAKKELSGGIGPRYVDTEELLGPSPCGGQFIEDESVPYSPILTPGGKLFVEDPTGAIWEIPRTTATKLGEEEFKTTPRVLYRLDERQTLVFFGIEEDPGPTMSFLSDGAGGGSIYLSAEILTQGEGFNGAALVLGYHGDGEAETATATEAGWTGGGHEIGGGGEGCTIPTPSGISALVGAFKAEGKEGVVVFDAYESAELKEKFVGAFQFGPGGSTKGCPTASATAPSVKVKGTAVSSLAAGEKALISSTLTGANAKSVVWKFKNLTTSEEETEETHQYQFQATSVEHVFLHPGKYRISETVEGDNLASPAIEAPTREVTVETAHPKVLFTFPGFVLAKVQTVKFDATVTDPNEAPPHLKYVWKFGDGGESSGAATGTAVSAEHVYAAPCACTVTLEVSDGTGAKGVSSATINVGEEGSPPPPPPTETTTPPPGEGPPPPPPGGGSAGFQEIHNPSATIAGTSLSVSAAGAFALKIGCPAGEVSCMGTATLRTLTAVSAGRSKKAVLTLASGSFTVAGGQSKVVTLHLSARGRALLARVHVLRAQVTLVAHDSAGVSKTNKATVTLRLKKSSARKR